MSSHPPARPAAAFFEALEGCFGEAASVRGVAERDVSVAGVPLRLRFAGDELLAAIYPSFAHLGESPAGAAAEVAVFEGVRSGVEAPAVPEVEAASASEAANPIVRYQGDEVAILAEPKTGLVTAGRGDGSRTLLYVPDPAEIPAPDWVGRFRGPLMLALMPRGLRLLHAGAVGMGGRGVLVSGRSGSGKTTLCIACAMAGMEICADDYVVLGEGDPPTVHALQSTASVSEESARMLGLERGGATDFEAVLGDLPKARFDLAAIAGGLVPRLEPAALIVPLRSGRSEPELRRVSAARGLQSLAPSTVFQQPPRDEGLLSAMAQLVSGLRCFELELSSDMAANAAAVREAVDGLA